MAIQLNRGRASAALASAALIAACCTGSVGFASLGAPTGGLKLRQSTGQSSHGLPRSPEKVWGMSVSTGATAALLFTAAAAFSAKCHREVGVQRQVKRGGTIIGLRNLIKFSQEKGTISENFGNEWVPGTGGGKLLPIRGTGHMKEYFKETPAPARMFLQKLRKKFAMGMYWTKDFYKTNKEVLAANDVKEVGTYMTEPNVPEKLITPAVMPGYRRPPRTVFLEKEKGDKRPPVEDEAYIQYIEKRFGLLAAAQEVCPSAATGKDVICERTTLMLLMDWMDESITKKLMRQGHHASPVDLVRVSKGPGGKGMVLERIFSNRDLFAELRAYKGSWSRGEISQHGTCSPAWERACRGDIHTRTYNSSGIVQIAGTSKGEFNTTHRFVEYDLGGLSFLSRVRAHLNQDGKNVELAHKNFYKQGDVTLLDTYMKMVLGKSDMYVLGLQRNGKLHQIVEVTVDSILEKQPAIVEVAEKRFGQVVAFLKQVQSALDDAESGDGPFVIQFYRGSLLLGKYEKFVPVEQEEEELVTA